MKIRFIQLLAFLSTCACAFAFPYDASQADIAPSTTASGIQTRTNGTVETYNIPISNWPDEINFSVRGGDGGRGKANASVGQDQGADGGGGALVEATFAVDPGTNNALRPGGELRLIAGSSGLRHDADDVAAGSGGGGSAVLYRAPEDDAEWVVIAVAGGGGGGVASTRVSNTYAREGKNASVTTSGTAGGNGGQSGGSNGQGGGSYLDKSGGGGGYLTGGGGEDVSGQDQWGAAGGTLGGAGGVDQSRGEDGGFGFGGGGASYTKSSSTAMGGGGGGYSGGGAGNNNGGGGGGGSYVVSWASDFSITERASTNTDGFVTASFTAMTQPVLTPPTVQFYGINTVTINDSETYNELGFLARDLYGNVITDSVVEDNVQERIVGTYLYTATATDQFGNSNSGSRTVVIVPANKPTFDHAGDITVQEDSGVYFTTNFITNFSANDDNQSISYYEVTNDNNALFTSQPSIDNFGTLGFYLNANANGTANVTIVAYDTPYSPTNGSSDPVTFQITVTGVADPPKSLGITSVTLAENATLVGTAYGNDPFGGTITFSIDGGNDGDHFTIDSETGELSFITPPDYEAPTDTGANNGYGVSILFTGSDGSKSKTYTIQVTDANDLPTEPVIDSWSPLENTTYVGTVSSTDQDGDALTYSISGGDDKDLFQIDSATGALSFIGAPDFENPTDQNGDNNYLVSIVASDGTGNSNVAAITVLVLDDNELPTDISLSQNSIAENSSQIGTVSGTDPAGGDLQFSLAGGADLASFQIDAASGVLSFITAPDYEAPTDQNGDNLYEVVVKIQGDEGYVTESYAITVTDETETALSEFRSTYGLATDGSDDDSDLSQNGVANIFYYLFGLGDPNDVDIDRTLMPSLTTSGDNVVFSYRCPFPFDPLFAQAVTSTDLATWSRLDQLSGDEAPSDVSTAMEADGYLRYTITIPTNGSARYFSVRPAMPASNE